MKKLFFLCLPLLMSLLAISSCNKEENDVREPNPLVGTWEYSKSTSSSNVIVVTIKNTMTYRADLSCSWTISTEINGVETKSTTADMKYKYSSSKKTLTLIDNNGSEDYYLEIQNGGRSFIIDLGESIQTYYKK